MTAKLFAAEIVITNPDDVSRVRAALKDIDCTFHVDVRAVGDWPTVFGFIIGTSELDENDLSNWLSDIVWPVGGDVVEWRYGEPWEISE
jgi:hypothetical protein